MSNDREKCLKAALAQFLKPLRGQPDRVLVHERVG